MSTKALIITWISMCVILLYSNSTLWIVVASSMAFATIRVVIVPLALSKVKSFPALSTFSQLLCSNTAVSILHSALSSALAIFALLTSHSLHGDYVNTVTRSEFVATSVSTGYFAYDLWDYVVNGLYIKSPGIVLHHVVVLSCYISALTRKSSLLRWVWRAQWTSFALVRFLPHVIVAVLTYQARRLFEHQLYFVMAFSGIIFINVLNAQLLLHSITVIERLIASRRSKRT
ncbi:unnamed protein product [Peronospora belbahrii]|uniref:TLC domain-containing protein n=1 Tax=Peronospora belbahrii TaxID=622444 RepID=A0AAU9KVI8_9STRA|nr:unnamed protein product [Peronospora belbahrii]